MAVEEANAAGGVPGKGDNRKVEVVYGDNAMSPTTAINALNRVLSDDPVAVLLSIRGTHVLPQLPLLQKAGVPGLTLTGVMKVTTQNNPYIFRFFPHDGMNKPPLMKYIVENAGEEARWYLLLGRRLRDERPRRVDRDAQIAGARPGGRRIAPADRQGFLGAA